MKTLPSYRFLVFFLTFFLDFPFNIPPASNIELDTKGWRKMMSLLRREKIRHKTSADFHSFDEGRVAFCPPSETPRGGKSNRHRFRRWRGCDAGKSPADTIAKMLAKQDLRFFLLLDFESTLKGWFEHFKIVAKITSKVLSKSHVIFQKKKLL